MNSLGSHVQNDKTKPHLLKDLKENLKKLPLNDQNINMLILKLFLKRFS